MKKYEDKVIPESTKKVLVETTCDMCKKEITGSFYEADEVKISRNHGTQYPEASYTKKDYVDLCGKCFQEKLIPWLKSQGCEMQTEDTGF